jgi:hypothetical protein
MTTANSKLETRIAAFTASLNPEEKQTLTEMEKTAIHVETQGLLQRSKGEEMTRTAQQVPPGTPMQEEQTAQGAPGMPPVSPDQQMQAQAGPPPMDPNMPMQAPVAAEGPFEQFIDEKESQDQPMGGAEMGITPPTAAYIGAYGHLKIRSTAERSLEVWDPGTGNVLMTIRPNKATRSGNLRQCASAILTSISQEGLTKTARIFKAQIRTAAGGIVDFGDNTFAEADKPDYEKPGESINARGDDVMRDIHYNENGVASTTSEGDQLTVPSGEGHQTRKAPGADGSPLNLRGGGKQKNAQNAPMDADGPPKEIADAGILGGHVTNMSDEVHNRDENDLNVTDMYDSNMRDDRKPYQKGTPITEGEIDTFANETLTASRERTMGQSRRAQGTPPPMSGAPPAAAPPPVMGQAQEPPPAPGCPLHDMMADPNCPQCQGMVGTSMAVGAQGSPAPMPAAPAMTSAASLRVPENMARYIRAKVDLEVKNRMSNFMARISSCLRMSARRQALNLEENVLKIAMADALMSPAFISRHEEYMPMDERTATFVIERGLNLKAAELFVDSLLKNAAQFYKMSDESLNQIRADLARQMPVQVQASSEEGDEPMEDKEAQAENFGNESEVPSEEEPEKTAGLTRRAAMGGNLPINTSTVQPPSTSIPDARSAVRAALGNTKGAQFHRAVSQRRAQ